MSENKEQKFRVLALPEVSFPVFVDFWADLYGYKSEHFYDDNIHNPLFTSADITQLYHWKNGSVLSQYKEKALRTKVLLKLDIINKLKSKFCMETFQSEFETMSTIWKIFLLHIIVPEQYPIFDQHVYRAFHYLKENCIQEIPDKDPEKEKIYFESYVPFFNNLAEKNTEFSRKRIDEAIWSFGKFLKSDYGQCVCT